MPGKGVAAAAGVAGVILVWSGVENRSVLTVVRDLIAGKKPAPGPATPKPAVSPTGGAASGAGIAGDALQYVGNSYVWGGTPGTVVGVDDGTDCSGFVNMVMGRDLGMAIPGYAAGGYNGSSHGPVTGAYLLWGGATTIPRSAVQPGDLACWLTHIGIFTDNGQNIVSALDTASGVAETTVEGGSPFGEPLTCRTVNVSAPETFSVGSGLKAT
jgi:cell wall-associated NlpC family hydrolase